MKLQYNTSGASEYDKKNEGLAAIKAGLHLTMRGILSELKSDAHLLCVGAGTGQELTYLANVFPKWRFTVVEPAPEMIKICIAKALAAEIDSRCVFHTGYVGSLPLTEQFDAATAILVSQFMMKEAQRVRFFSDIATRLKRGGRLINAELASDMQSDEYNQLLTPWLSMHANAGIAASTEPFGKAVSVVSTDSIQNILTAGGFVKPTLFFQALLIHAWYSVKQSSVD